jgi:hypothetical protein
MDVLELPKPVINFLRTMSSERDRYLLSWDLYGNSTGVTLSLTWKLNVDATARQTTTDPVISHSHHDTDQIESNEKIKKSSSFDFNVIPPPSDASSNHREKTRKPINHDSDCVNRPVSILKKDSKSKSKVLNYYDIEADDDQDPEDENDTDNTFVNNTHQQMPSPFSSCIYFPNKKSTANSTRSKNSTNNKQSNKIYSDNRIGTSENNSKRSTSETDIFSHFADSDLEDHYSTLSLKQNRNRNVHFAHRIVDYNLQSPIYKQVTPNRTKENNKSTSDTTQSPWTRRKSLNLSHTKL